MEKGKKVGLWIRVSTDWQVKRDSPENHEERGRWYAKAQGWEIVKVYRLEAMSGKSIADYPETKRMLRDIKEGAITGLIFSQLKRFARNTRELLEFADYFEECNADLISLKESIDTSTPAGRLFYTIMAALGEWERESTAQQVRDSIPPRARLGKPLGGAAPYGYAWVDKKMELNKEEAPIRKLMYELFLKHKRKKAVAKELNDRGYRTRKGANFSSTTITRLLRDPIAKGLKRANYTQSLGEGKHWELKSPDEWIFTKAPRIISDEIWNQVQAILDDQASKNKRKSRRTRHLFAGATQCICGGKMLVPSNNPKYTCKACKNKIGIDDLEEIFHSQLEGFLYSDVEITGYLDKANQVIKDKENLLANALKEGDGIQTKLNNLLDLYHAGELPKSGFSSHYEPLHEKLKSSQKNVAMLEGEIDALKLRYISSDQTLHEARTLHERWGSLPANEKRTIIENIVESIIIGESEIEINLSHLPYQPSSPPTPPSPELITTREHNHRDSSMRPKQNSMDNRPSLWLGRS